MALLPEILVVDLEATCWSGAPPPGQHSEIIEIGVCLLDPGTGERGEAGSLLVRPRVSTISEFCARLTTLTQEQVDAGLEFEAACEVLRERYASERRIWAGYGAYDRRQFITRCERLGVPYLFSERHINVKTGLAAVGVVPRPVGMAGALKRLGLPLEGTHHRGGDDAWNIAALLNYLLERGVRVEDLVRLSSEGASPAP